MNVKGGCRCDKILTLDRGQDIGAKPDRWVFVKSKHPTVTLPDDGLPKHTGWENSPNAG